MVKLLSISNSDLLRVLTKLVAALGLFFLLNLLLFMPLNYMYFNSYGGNSGAQINNVLRQKSDIFIFGASRAAHHFDPDLISKATGMSVFNAGDDGKNSAYQLGLLKMLIKKHKPKLIIYEVGDLKGLDGGTVDLFPYYFQDTDIRSILRRRDKWIPFKMMFPLYAYNQKFFSITKGYISHTETIKTGFRPIEGIILPAEVSRAKSDFQAEIKQRDTTRPDDFLVDCFTLFVSECSSQMIGLIFVYSPSFIPSNPIGEDVINDLSASEEINWYNFGVSSKYNWNNHLFKDASHLNRLGAGEFTQDLIKKVFHTAYTYNLKQRFVFAKNKFPEIGRSIDVINGGNLFRNLESLLLKNELFKDGNLQDLNNKDPDLKASLELVKWFNKPDYGWSQDFFKALQSIDSLCYDHGCRLYLYVPTYSKTFYARYRELGVNDEFTNKVKQSVIHADIDLSMRAISDRMFCDPVHVNAVGKELQTNWIISLLGNIDSHKGEQWAITGH